MINLIANNKLKILGCKWDGSQWIAPELAKNEAQLIKDKFYTDLIAIEVTVKEGEKLDGADWGRLHSKIVGGYIVATASGRDSGAKIFDGVAIIKGKFSSGGSQKNYFCYHTEELILRLKVSKNVLEILDNEVKQNKYTYKILEDNKKNDKEELFLQKEKLLSQLKEIEQKISIL